MKCKCDPFTYVCLNDLFKVPAAATQLNRPNGYNVEHSVACNEEIYYILYFRIYLGYKRWSTGTRTHFPSPVCLHTHRNENRAGGFIARNNLFARVEHQIVV